MKKQPGLVSRVGLKKSRIEKIKQLWTFILQLMKQAVRDADLDRKKLATILISEEQNLKSRQDESNAKEEKTETS